jgi:small nuclear ribonucleoprotein (snRNP)-like protein
VKFNGGREVWGELKSWDKSMNLVLDNTKEVIGLEGKEELTRDLGFIIVKGLQIHSISLKNGYTIIDNPFL